MSEVTMKGEEIPVQQAIQIAFEAGNVCFADIVLEEIADLILEPVDRPLETLLSAVNVMRATVLNDIEKVKAGAGDMVADISANMGS